MIKVEHLSHFYHSNQVLKDINFSQEQGTVTAIIGPNGSGKTTLLRTLNALATPSKGSITIDDYQFNAEQHTKKDIYHLRQQSAMVFQNYNLFKNKTVLENITEGLIYGQGKGKREAIHIAEDHLNMVNLLEHKDKYPIQLSGGQSQRVGIVRALALNPKVLLLDEPTSALDPESIQSVLNLIQRIAQQGMTMVIVTHEISFAEAIADQILFIDNGELVVHGSPSDVLYNQDNDRIQRFIQRIRTEVDVN